MQDSSDFEFSRHDLLIGTAAPWRSANSVRCGGSSFCA